MKISRDQNLVRHWFQQEYQNLHPTLQEFHNKGGVLIGEATITYGNGSANTIAGFIAKRLAKKMQIPSPGNHHLRVDIEPTSNGLIWNRTFNNTKTIQSLFTPQGTINDGHWIEQTGKLTIHLTVDIKKGGWYWRPLRIKYGNIPVPLYLIPQTTAYKTIEENRYKFHVSFSFPMLGTILSYSGKLTQKRSVNKD